MRLRLLGTFQVGNETDITLRRKNRAILAYLALSPRPRTRHELASLFCQSAADPAHTLRLSLSRLRRSLGELALLSRDETVRFNPDYFQTDVHSFQQVLSATSLHDVPSEQLAETVPLYRGEFLEGLALPDAPEFEMWLVGQRSYWWQLYERGALAWLKQLITRADYATAIPIAQRLVRHNPILEEAHYHLIWLYAQTEQRAAALSQYAQCQSILQRELAVAPTPDLQTLHADILAGRLSRPRMSLAVQPQSTSAPTPTLDFVGREAEWQQLDHTWREVQQGGGRVILISAEAGGGKTRLVQEWAKTFSEAAYLYGPCYESTRSLVYHPWFTVLEQLNKRLDAAAVQTLPPTWRNILARLLPGLMTQDFPSVQSQQNQFFAAVHALLGLCQQPLCLFLDDLQWADAASLQLIHFLVERETPMLLVGAYRSEEAEDNPALLTLLRDWGRHGALTMLNLEPLTSEAVVALMRRSWPQLPDGYREPHLRDRLIQATGGNPLFVSEIARELAGTTQLPETLPVPPSLRDLIQRRLQQLPISGRQVLESLAILDQPTPFDLARQISGRSEDETLEALELGLRWRLLLATSDTPSLVDFYHDLMGQAVREQLSPMRRQLLHRRAAASLGQQGAKAARLAYHWGKAGETRQERIHAIQAGHDAAALYAYQEAIGYWQRALELTTKSDQKASLLHQLGRAWMILGDWDKAETLFQTGLALLGAESSQIRAELQAAYGLLLEYKGEYAAALAQEEPALAYFQSVNDRPQIARTLGLIALLHWRQTRYDEALEICQQALTDLEALTDPTTHIRLLNISGMIFWRRQAYETSIAHLQRAHELAVRHQDQQYEAIVVRNLGNVVQEMGQYDQAIDYYQQSLAINQAMQNKIGLTMDWGNLGLMYFYKGDDEAALEYGHHALQMARELGSKESMSFLLSNLANSFSRLERHTEALAYCQEALLIDAGIGNRRGALIHAGNMSDIYLLRGHTTEALLCLAYALHLDDRLEHKRELARHLVNIVAVYLFLNQLSQAEAVCRWAMALQQELANTFELGWAFLVQGRLFLAQERFAAAADSLHQAVQNAQAAHRADIQFEAEVLLPRTQWLAGQLDAAAASHHLQTMLENELTLIQRAAIFYEQWLLDKNKIHHHQARRAYGALLQQFYTAEARQRAIELGATDLPPIAAAPPLPSLITDTPLNLNSLLEKIRQTVPSPVR